MEIKIALFDKDGTLLDSSNATRESHIQTLSPIATRDEVTRLIDSTLGYAPDRQYAIIRLVKERNLTLDDIIVNENKYLNELSSLREDSTTLQLLDKFWSKVKQIRAPAYPDVREGLHILKYAGFKLGISTGYRLDITREQLRTNDLLKYFEEDLIFGHDPPITKGEPHIQELKRKLGLTEEQLSKVYMIGDGPGDMQTARMHNMIGYGIDRIGNSKQLMDNGALKIFYNLVECSRYILNSLAVPVR